MIYNFLQKLPPSFCILPRVRFVKTSAALLIDKPDETFLENYSLPPTPFDSAVDSKQSQEQHSFRPPVDPELTSVLLFPGQGSQFVGMGNKLQKYPNVSRLFQTASKILGYDLLDVCLNGPKEKLDMTVYCQPAIFVTSIAAVEVLKSENPTALTNCVAAAGFSVGELAALVAAGAISYEDGLDIVKVRAASMQAASEKVPSGMMSAFVDARTKLSLAIELAIKYCEVIVGIPKPVCSVASYLYPGCKVIAGHSEALDFIEKHAAEFGIRRTKQLPVSGAFHTELMQSAVEPVSAILESISISEPSVWCHSNVDGKKHEKSLIKKRLCRQICRPVKWEQILHIVYSRRQGTSFPASFEVGPGRQLGTILRLVNRKAFESYKNVEV